MDRKATRDVAKKDRRKNASAPDLLSSMKQDDDRLRNVRCSNFVAGPRHWSAAPARRLWSYLVRQEPVQELFIRCVFGKRRSAPSITELVESVSGERDRPDAAGHNLPEPVRIIHKEQDSITAFCLNNVSTGLLALATPREVQEMDISLLLEMPSWLEDECELDLMSLNKEPELLPTSGFLVNSDTHPTNQWFRTPPTTLVGPPALRGAWRGRRDVGPARCFELGTNIKPIINSVFTDTIFNETATDGTKCVHACPTVCSGSVWHCLAGDSGGAASPLTTGATLCVGQVKTEAANGAGGGASKGGGKALPVLKHRVDNIRRVSAHPLLPLYLTGSQDGSVQMWEWGHAAAVTVARPSGTFAKVTRVRFSQHGNKFGVSQTVMETFHSSSPRSGPVRRAPAPS
ncbi:dmX-like protein 1, partial [Homalodisca vitripennis]|uniref:dmX-like protein 1 n=1 Tax=Homalodisca vitripennis TaxID=197043 RepID=UPI001EEC3653